MFTTIVRAAGAAAIALAAYQATAEEYPEVSLRMAHPLPETWPAVQWDKWWAEEVERRSGGKIQIEMFWSGQLGGLLEIKNLVSSGAVDLGVFAQAVHASEMPMTSVAAGLLNRVSADAATAQKLAGEVYAADATRAELDALNLHPIKWTVTSPYRLTCNKQINRMSDLEGLRVRAVGGAYVPIWMEAYGMVPTRVQAPEIREGLQRGTLDCNFGPIEWVPFFSLQSVAPYVSDINTGTFTTFQIYAPADRWNSWPENVRSLMTEVAQEAMAKDLEWLEGAEAEAYAAVAEAGGQMIELADMEAFIAKSPDMISVWEERMTEAGMGDAIAGIVPLQREAAQSFAQ
ncbi:TRAP transporter substrate-binding protein DctP [Aestuariivita sp.]|jgi:TRAP-type C4-dicarboxylate transport system substrate-binding protein|uniref:TRAP transporter substrate-binding protein DctP n=1 Tax=Aestuariivita sp. TaxID=1872407 RepID=UPI00216CD273|nr:TRAP transporter substrate-binding protein DctP [Aestuariivita sp.]MCE8005650.1 TRAP transporter substrate-binding protein DctP [Aestuariivita sp.]